MKNIDEQKIWKLINGILGCAYGASVSHTDAYSRAKEIIQKEREEAYKQAKMELEVEIGLQNFGQLIKEKEKIQEEAVRGFLTELNKHCRITKEGDVGETSLEPETVLKRYLSQTKGGKKE